MPKGSQPMERSVHRQWSASPAHALNDRFLLFDFISGKQGVWIKTPALACKRSSQSESFMIWRFFFQKQAEESVQAASLQSCKAKSVQ